MDKYLIMMGAWLALAFFFLFLNLKISRAGMAKILSYWFMIASAGVAVYLAVRATMEI